GFRIGMKLSIPPCARTERGRVYPGVEEHGVVARLEVPASGHRACSFDLVRRKDAYCRRDQALVFLLVGIRTQQMAGVDQQIRLAGLGVSEAVDRRPPCARKLDAHVVARQVDGIETRGSMLVRAGR